MNKVEEYVQELREFMSEVLQSLHRIQNGMMWRNTVRKRNVATFGAVADGAGNARIVIDAPTATVRYIHLLCFSAASGAAWIYWDDVDPRRLLFPALGNNSNLWELRDLAIHSGHALVANITGAPANGAVFIVCIIEDTTVPAGFQQHPRDTQDGRTTDLPMEPGAPTADEGTRWGTGPLIREMTPTHEQAGGNELAHDEAVHDGR